MGLILLSSMWAPPNLKEFPSSWILAATGWLSHVQDAGEDVFAYLSYTQGSNLV